MRKIRQERWTANWESTVAMVYTLKMFGRGRCLLSVVKGFDLEMKRKQPASNKPCNVA